MDIPSRAGAPYDFALRMALVYSAFFAYVGIILPFFPVWLDARGLTEAEIAQVLALPMLVRVFTSGAISAYADTVRERANVLILLMGGTAFSLLLFLLSSGYWQILAIALLLALFSHPIQPVMDSITLLGVRRHGFDYGRIRLWGSVVFIGANLAGGAYLAAEGALAMMPLIAATAIAAFLLSPITPRLGPGIKPDARVGEQGATSLELVRNVRFMLVMAGCGIVQATHAMVYGFGSIHWAGLGFSGTLIGLLWAIGVVAEIILFQFSRQALARVSAVQLCMIGAIASVIRFGLMSLEAGVAGFVMLQALHGLSFGATHLGLMHYCIKAVPEGRIGAAQAVSFVVAAIAMGMVSYVCGPLYAAFGGNAFFFMALAGASGGLLLVLGARDQPQRPESGG